MNKFFKTLVSLIVVVLSNSSCSNRGPTPMAKSLKTARSSVTDEMKNAVADSAFECGFKHIIRNVRITSVSIIYIDARAESQNLEVVFYQDTRNGDVVIIVGDNNRGMGEEFDREGSKKFLCFEAELNRRLPHVFYSSNSHSL